MLGFVKKAVRQLSSGHSERLAVRPHAADFVRPGLASVPSLHADRVLVAAQDVYAQPESARPVLLLKQGMELDAPTFYRLVYHQGVDPAFFQVKDDGTGLVADGDAPADAPAMAHTNPLLKTVRSTRRAVVCDTEKKSLDRTIQCLVTCGLSLGKIQPVRRFETLAWSIAKYQPDVLVVDYDGGRGLGVLETYALAEPERFDAIEEVIVLIPPESEAFHDEEMLFSRLQALAAKILLKPVNRFTLNDILE